MPSKVARQHMERQRRIGLSVAAKATRAWKELGKWDREDIPRWLERIKPITEGASRQATVTMEAYLARELGRRPMGVDPEDVLSRTARSEGELAQPFLAFWKSLKGGADFDTAMEQAASMAGSMARDEVSRSALATAREIGQRDSGIYGWERVPDGDACELCLIASTQRYHIEDLQPIHSNCHCGVEPLTEPTGQIINRGRLDEIKAQQKARAAERAAA